MARGNTSVSNLLRAARAAQQKQYSLEDSIAAYEYDLSPKDSAAFEKYQAHLNNRIQQYQSIDPLKALNYQKTLTAANRSFTSAEISRATTQVLYGNIDNRTKLNTMIQLYQRALENGDENLAQRIEGQAAQLQYNMNRYYGGRGYGFSYGGGYGSGVGQQFKNSVNNQVKMLEDDLRTLRGSLNSGGNFALGQIESTGGGRTYFSSAKGIIEQIANTYREAANQAEAFGDPQTAQEYRQKYDAIVGGEQKYDIGFAGKNNKKSLLDINKFIEERDRGSNPTHLVVNADGSVSLARNPVANFGQYTRNADGSIDFTEKRNLFLDDAYRRALDVAQNRLRDKGIDSKIQNGYLKFLDKVTGQEVTGTVDPYGNILYHGIDDQGNPVMKRFVTSEGKDEIVSRQEQEAILNNPNSFDQERVVLPPEEEFKRNVNQYIRKTAANKMVEDIKKGVAGLGQSWDSFTKEFGGLFSLNPFQQQATIKRLQDKYSGVFRKAVEGLGQSWDRFVKEAGGMPSLNPFQQVKRLQDQYSALQQAKELERRNQEIAFQRSNEIANRYLQQQRALEASTKARSVVFKPPQLPLPPDPDARAIISIRRIVEDINPLYRI
jgi:hypothetical protein